MKLSNLTIAFSGKKSLGFSLNFIYETIFLLITLMEHTNIKPKFLKFEDCGINQTFIDAYLMDLRYINSCNIKNFEISPMTSLKRFSVLAPNFLKIPRYKYIAMPFDIYVGFLLIITNLIFGTASALIWKLHGKFDIINEVFNGLLISTNQSSKLPSKNHPLLRYVYFLMIIFGLIFTNLYSAYLNSFLVTGINRPTSKVICNPHISEVLIPKLSQFEFQNLDYMHYEYSIRVNANKAYCISDNMYKKFEYFQKSMKKNLYRLESPWITDITYSSFLIFNKDSKYKLQLEKFISTAYSVGLTEKWLEFGAAEEMNFIKLQNRKDSENFLKLKDLKLVFACIVCSYILSTFVFVIEILKTKHC